MQKSEILRLIDSIKAALCAGGISEDIAGPFAELVKDLAGLLPDEFSVSKSRPTGLAELVQTIDREWMRSSHNIRAVLLTALRDKPEHVVKAKLDELLRMHLSFELFMLQDLLELPSCERLAVKPESPQP